jgi:hypothetical protein
MKLAAHATPQTPQTPARTVRGGCGDRPANLSAGAARRYVRRARRGAWERLLLDVAWPLLLLQVATHTTSYVSSRSRSSAPDGPAMAPLVFFVGAANWAQVMGEQRQNTASPARGYFSPRWGHQTVHIDSSSGTETVEAMIVLGGDTLESGVQNRAAVSVHMQGVHKDGSRGFRNDVHAASSYRWRVYKDQVEKTEYNKGMPHVEGSMEWEVN